ncbi:shieldin complex subunit 2 [Thalassophryne amazonica]|uniref:shieldin complex subunit 2 n=1 Tax=Thalassophryne amazonica TaxID=390379 RepID=UPI001471F3B3|nr:shieldin complex subunit 2 [Thalassophryne amazonica]
MCERHKVHVFLGAPRVASEAVADAVCPSAGWTCLQLCWQDGRLQPAAEKLGGRVRSGKEGTDWRSTEDDPHQDSSTPKPGQSRESSGDRGPPVGSEHKCISEDVFCSEGHRHGGGEESRTINKDQCSASLHEYLDTCFPAQKPETGPHEPEASPDQSQQPSFPAVHLSVQSQYLATWTLSQALILRSCCNSQSETSPEKTLQTSSKCPQPSQPDSSSTPELFSPAAPNQSPGTTQPGSAELFSQPTMTPLVRERGSVLQRTVDGMLCSQGVDQQEQAGAEPNKTSTANESHSLSPNCKKARMSADHQAEASADTSGDAAAARFRDPTTRLVKCDQPGGQHSVLVVVVHPCHLKEVRVKSGPCARSLVPLASIVVTDQSGVEMKVVLWRRAAFWVLTVGPGDILLITALQVKEDRWRGEMLLQSTCSSKLLHLGQITASTSPPVPRHVSPSSLNSLCVFLREKRPLLVSLPLRTPQDLSRLPYAPLRSLQVSTLVHALLCVTSSHLSTEPDCRSAVLSVEQPGCQQGALLLWGSAVDWLLRFRDRAAVWDFRFLLVREGLTSDLPELHSTPWSSVRPVDPADPRMQKFVRLPFVGPGGGVSLDLDLDTLLSQKYSGEVELKVQVTTFQFQYASPSQNAPWQVLDGFTPLSAILVVLSSDVTYTGCGRCSAELGTDANGIYVPCYPCLPCTAVRCYYRPAVLTVSGRGSQVRVQVPPVPLQKILDAAPDKLLRSSGPGSEVRLILVAAERIQTLLALPRKTFTITIQSHFLCDENSIPLSQEFTLLDLQFPR